MSSRSKKRFDTNGITFKTWLLFSVFALIILISLWILQSLSLKPYYRQVKVADVNDIAERIIELLRADTSNGEEIADITYNNNLCISIYNHQKQPLSNINAMGLGCHLTNDQDFDTRQFLQDIEESSENSVSVYQKDTRFENESLIYGIKVNTLLESYYLLIDAVINPIDSTVFIIRNQFLWVALFIFLISILLAFMFSRAYLRPINDLTEGAVSIANGNYDIELKKQSFTELDELADTLMYASRELEKTEEIRRDLLANMGHDLKTPLTTIKAYAEMIQDISGSNKKKRDEHLDIIISETNYLNRLVNDMMTLTKVQSSAIEPDIQAFDLCETVKQISDVLAATASTSEVEVKLDLPPSAVIYGDRLLLGQVIYNFLTNAIKHAGKDRQVIVRVTAERENWRLDVIDHGSGISAQDIPHIWDRYYKANKQYQRNQEQNSGLGLAIAKAYLELHHFVYGVNSKPGQGSDFYFITRELNQQ